MMELDQALIQLDIEKETLDEIIADGESKNELIAVLMHCLYKVPEAKDAAAVLLQYIADARMDGGPGSGNFGHKGVPGQVGGSAPSDESNNSAQKKKAKYAGLSAEGRKVVEDNIKNPNHFGESDEQKESNRKKLISALKEKGVETKYVEEKGFEGLGYGSYVAIDPTMTYDENVRMNQALNQTTYSFGFDRSDYIKTCKDSGKEPRLSSDPETPYDGVFYSKSGKYQKDDTPVYSYSDASTQLSDEEIVRFSGHDEELNPDGAAKAASAAQKAIASMSDEERGALKNYTSQYGNGSYSAVNEYLINGTGSEETKKAAEQVTAALDHEIGADCICSRGAGSVHGTKDDKAAAKIIGQIEKGNFSNAGKLKDILVGQVIKNDAAMSTSPGGSTSGYGQRPVQMTFKTPAEAKAVNITSLSNYGGGASEAAKALASTGVFGSIAYESEVLFKPGTRYKIDDVQFSISVDGKNKKSGKIHIVASILTDRNDGGPGSGNWGHEGVEGQLGGSAPGGGKHNRITKENGSYTSFSKRQKKAATPHIVKARELAKMPIGTKVIGYGSDVWEKYDDSYYINLSTGELEGPGKIAGDTIDSGTKLSLAIPKSASKNYSIGVEHELQPEELDQPVGAKLHMNGKVYVQTSKNIWENPEDDEDFYLNSELKHGNKKGFFEKPDGKPVEAKKPAEKKEEPAAEYKPVPLFLGAKLMKTGIGTQVKCESGETWEKINKSDFVSSMTGEVLDAYHLEIELHDKDAKIAISEPKKSASKTIKTTMTESDLFDYPNGTQIKAADGIVYTKVGPDFWTGSDKPEKWIFADDTAEKITNAGGASEITDPSTAAKNSIKSIGSGVGCNHPDDCFTATRRGKAVMHKTAEAADKMFRKQSGEIWQQCDKTTKQGFSWYTSGGYRTINPYLRGEESDASDSCRDQIRGMTEAIDKCAFEHDVVLPRGSGKGSISTMLGCKKNDLDDPDFLENLTGREMTDEGFLSCGTSQSSGFDKRCRLEIYCPKGTKGIYAEPFSSCGAGDHINWDGLRIDGKSEQSFFSSEDETILQRGTTLRITKAYFDENIDKIVIKCEVVRQEPNDF